MHLTVPLFPLPGTVLFPEVTLPFYVFEPRYRAMLAEVLDGAGLIGIPLLLPGFESSVDGSPPIARVFGVGSVEQYVTHEDGTSHIQVFGRWRVRLLEEVPSQPFRRARVSVTTQVLGERQHRRLGEMLHDLLRNLKSAGLDSDGREALIRRLEDPEADLVRILNAMCTVLVEKAMLRQVLLECPEPAARARLLGELVGELNQNPNPGA